MADTNPILFFSSGTCSFGAIVALEWAGTPYQLCRADKAERATDAYKKINVLGQVPAYKTGERVITENLAIHQHIAAEKPELGFKPGTAEYDMLNTCLSWYSSNYHPAWHAYFAPMRFHDDEKVQAEIKKKAESNIRTKFDNLELWFNGQERHFQSKKTVVDAYGYGIIRWGSKIFDIAKEYPNVGKFMTAQEKDPAVQFALAIEKGENAKTTGKFQGLVKLEEVKAPVRKAA